VRRKEPAVDQRSSRLPHLPTCFRPGLVPWPGSHQRPDSPGLRRPGSIFVGELLPDPPGWFSPALAETARRMPPELASRERSPDTRTPKRSTVGSLSLRIHPAPPGSATRLARCLIMPTSVSAVLVPLIAVFPGLIGNWVYQNLVGVDWREREWRSVLRMLGFSYRWCSVVFVGRRSLRLASCCSPFPKRLFQADSDQRSIERDIHTLRGASGRRLCDGFLGRLGCQGYCENLCFLGLPGSMG
jgi:hypothetical protein